MDKLDDLLALARAVASLNPEVPEIGHGMLRNLHSMAVKALESHAIPGGSWEPIDTAPKYTVVRVMNAAGRAFRAIELEGGWIDMDGQERDPVTWFMARAY